MSSCKSIDTPSFSSSKLVIISGALYYDSAKYRQIVDALQYLTFTMFDICYVVNKACQFMHAPIENNWAAVKCILSYLQAMTSYCLYITRGSSLSLHGFIDVDWDDSVDNRKFISGYLVYLGNTHIFLEI